MQGVIFGLDVGSTQICALVGEVQDGLLRIVGYGTEPAQGIRKGMVVDVAQASVAIARAVSKAEQTSGYDLNRVILGVTGEHVQSMNNSGAVAISNRQTGVTGDDIARALDAARAIPIPHNQQILHLLPRSYTIDSQNSVKSPLGMHGFRLEVEAHIITAASPAVQNLVKCADTIGLQVEELVLHSLASAEAVLTPAEKEMGVLVIDIGGGTTDIALYSGGSAWFTKTIPVGGSHIANDIAIGLRIPFELAEEIKLKYGDCRPEQISPTLVFNVEQFNEEKIPVGRQDLAYVIEARVEEIFNLVSEAIKQSGYNGLLPAGVVLCGGGAHLKGISEVAHRVLGVNVRIASPRNLMGLVDSLQGPEYASSVGLLRWAISEHNVYRPDERQSEWSKKITSFLRALLPG